MRTRSVKVAYRVLWAVVPLHANGYNAHRLGDQKRLQPDLELRPVRGRWYLPVRPLRPKAGGVGAPIPAFPANRSYLHHPGQVTLRPAVSATGGQTGNYRNQKGHTGNRTGTGRPEQRRAGKNWTMNARTMIESTKRRWTGRDRSGVARRRDRGRPVQRRAIMRCRLGMGGA